MEFRYGLTTLCIPVIVVVVGTGYEWERSEVSCPPWFPLVLCTVNWICFFFYPAHVNSPFSFEGQLCTFSWVPSLLGRYFYNMLFQSECACLHKTVNIVVFFVKSNENTYPKGRALIQMYRVIPITKHGNMTILRTVVLLGNRFLIVWPKYKWMRCWGPKTHGWLVWITRWSW